MTTMVSMALWLYFIISHCQGGSPHWDILSRGNTDFAQLQYASNFNDTPCHCNPGLLRVPERQYSQHHGNVYLHPEFFKSPTNDGTSPPSAMDYTCNSRSRAGGHPPYCTTNEMDLQIAVNTAYLQLQYIPISCYSDTGQRRVPV